MVFSLLHDCCWEHMIPDAVNLQAFDQSLYRNSIGLYTWVRAMNTHSLDQDLKYLFVLNISFYMWKKPTIPFHDPGLQFQGQ